MNDDALDNNNLSSNTKLVNTFRDEANELVNELENILLMLEKDITNSDAISRVFRIMHTIKGASGMFGFTMVSNFTHHMEDIYDKIRNNQLNISAYILNVTLNSIDHLRNLINNPLDNSNTQIHNNLMQQISKVLSDNKFTNNTEITATEITNTKPSLKCYYIYFNPDRHILNDGTNTLYLIQDLHLLGKCIAIPFVNNIPIDNNFNVEHHYILWHILLETEQDLNDIEDNFVFVNDNSKPIIKQVAENYNLIENTEFINKFNDAAKFEVEISNITQWVENLKKVYEVKEGTEEVNEKVKDVQNEISDLKEIKSNLSSLRVSAEKVDIMMNLVSELIARQAELSLMAEEYGNNQMKEVAESIESIARSLRNNAFSISLIPLEQSLVRFQRMVRDVSRKFNKKVTLTIEGGETEIDKTIIEGIIDPIMHMLRNSIDHGIESPAERVKVGKPEIGKIILKAYYSGSNIVIQISDDGAGINLDKVKETAIKKGMLNETDKVSSDDLIQLILHAGFTTAENISEVSGRGVGMDVVYQKIREIRGDLQINTEKGKGTTITILLPLTISIIDALMVKVSDSLFMIPLSSINFCDEVHFEDLNAIKNNYLVIQNNYTPIIKLWDYFNLQIGYNQYLKIIVINYNNLKVGIIVEQIIGKCQAVLKPLGELYKQHEIISGASILGNGEIALVLDINKLVRKHAALHKNEINNKRIVDAPIY